MLDTGKFYCNGWIWGRRDKPVRTLFAAACTAKVREECPGQPVETVLWEAGVSEKSGPGSRSVHDPYGVRFATDVKFRRKRISCQADQSSQPRKWFAPPSLLRCGRTRIFRCYGELPTSTTSTSKPPTARSAASMISCSAMTTGSSAGP
jgi:hypothetical protein